MGMTIEEALEEVDRQILCLTDAGNITKEVLALEKLVDIAHRYQQLQEVYKKWFCEDTSAEAYTKISEILGGNPDSLDL